MASIAVVGKSGTGKSTSYGQFPELGIKGLNPKETVVINVRGKISIQSALNKALPLTLHCCNGGRLPNFNICASIIFCAIFIFLFF